ncbi:hypothetical protein T07_1551 [Trichinella nelsoni]|uniref:Uncharacterized protein n=1 Tax=Trichinella nelsoni TaxID=6336 RepID=A0A0V0RBZ9_9BILA|nr:hypothetical protein T07_1551 [Trichinella nelsoni]
MVHRWSGCRSRDSLFIVLKLNTLVDLPQLAVVDAFIVDVAGQSRQGCSCHTGSTNKLNDRRIISIFNTNSY